MEMLKLKVDDTVLNIELIHCLKCTRELYGLGFNSITEENTFAVRLSIRWALKKVMVLVLILSQENTFAVRLSIRRALENLMVLVLVLSQMKTLLL